MAEAGGCRVGGRTVRCARPLKGGLVVQLPELCQVRWGQLQAVWCRCLRGVSVQHFGVRGHGIVPVTGGGRGRLTVESVCDRWMVQAVAP
jgi:hypothetical protein